MDNKLEDQSSSSDMSLQIHPSANNKEFKFDECKLIHNQTDRLTEVMNAAKSVALGQSYFAHPDYFRSIDESKTPC